jgi:NTE family protein
MASLSVTEDAAHTPCWYSCGVNQARLIRPRFKIYGVFFAFAWLAAASPVLAQHEVSAGPAQLQPKTARPRIGLVLSGGGARGAAHIGVLKVLDDLRVPIDAIAGTSMGAVVGGLYASGFSAREIETIMTSVNWQEAFRDRPSRTDLTFRRKEEEENFLVNFPLGLRSRHFQLPKGLIQGQKLSQILRRLTLPMAGVTDFDALPTRFRAVATDLETGDPVIMHDGDLASAMRASLSAPGVFAPVERDGRLLVDGGLAENLPIDVARAMGVDILIVVDVSAPLVTRDKLTSAPAISNQMLAILIRRNAERQLESLSRSDVRIAPILGEYSSYDFGIVTRAVDAGEQAALAAQQQLLALALTPAAYERYAQRRSGARQAPPRIQFVRIEPGSERYAESLHKLFDDQIGAAADPNALARRVTAFYGGENFEGIDYQVVQDDSGQYGLALTARRNSWGPTYVRFGLNLQDDFAGNSNYNAAARFVQSEITQAGGEWIADLQVGETSRVSTEVWLPFSQTSPYFLAPHTQLEAQDLYLYQNQRRIAEYRVRTFEYGLDFGRDFSNWGEIRAGLVRDVGSSSVVIGEPTLATGAFDEKEFFMRLSYDTLDNVNFPREGQQASFEWRGDRTGLGSDVDGDRLAFNYLAARSFGRQTAVFWTSAGTTLDGSITDVRKLFTLGGFLNLSGMKQDSLIGPNYGIARLLFYRQIGRGGPGFLDVPAYIGTSFELGNVWQHRGDANFGSAHKDASLFLGLDTLIGPVYIGTGIGDGGTANFYLFLGRTF